MQKDVSQRARNRVARQYVGDTNHPVVEVEGDAAPCLIGHRYYFTSRCTATQRACRVEHSVVRHPSAYGYPTQYHPSTLRVVVGSVWLDQYLTSTK